MATDADALKRASLIDPRRVEKRMQAYKIETTVDRDRLVTVQHLPFPAGERVEVIVLPTAPRGDTHPAYPLQGTAYRYDNPLEPVAEADWEAEQ